MQTSKKQTSGNGMRTLQCLTCKRDANTCGGSGEADEKGKCKLYLNIWEEGDRAEKSKM